MYASENLIESCYNNSFTLLLEPKEICLTIRYMSNTEFMFCVNFELMSLIDEFGGLCQRWGGSLRKGINLS